MAGNKETISFDDIIQADRLRRKNEALAQEIFGKGRRSSTPSNGNRKPGSGPSLASRIGIAKASQRSISSAPRLKSNGTSFTKQSPTLNSPRIPQEPRSAPSNPMTRSTRTDRRNERLYDAALSTTQQNGDGLSIRGLAGPYVVIGQNFAPGTTAADIESAMVPTGGEIQSCRIISSSPTVIAEMVFVEKHNAEAVISTFNNKKADGRLLHLFMKQGPPSVPPSAPMAPAPKVALEPRIPHIDLTRKESPYDRQREEYDRNRRRAEPEFQDGSYGFEAKSDRMDVDMDDRRDNWQSNRRDEARNRDFGRERDDRRLYSDNLYPRPRGRGFR